MNIRSHAAVGLALLLPQPGHAVFLYKAMLRIRHPVQREIAFRPFEISARHVDCRRRSCAATRRIHSSGAGIGEQVQKFLPLRQLTNPTPRQAVIEKQAGVQIVVKVDEKAIRPFAYLLEFTLIADLFVLRQSLLLSAARR